MNANSKLYANSSLNYLVDSVSILQQLLMSFSIVKFLIPLSYRLPFIFSSNNTRRISGSSGRLLRNSRENKPPMHQCWLREIRKYNYDGPMGVGDFLSNVRSIFFAFFACFPSSSGIKWDQNLRAIRNSHPFLPCYDSPVSTLFALSLALLYHVVRFCDEGRGCGAPEKRARSARLR